MATDYSDSQFQLLISYYLVQRFAWIYMDFKAKSDQVSVIGNRPTTIGQQATQRQFETREKFVAENQMAQSDKC